MEITEKDLTVSAICKQFKSNWGKVEEKEVPYRRMDKMDNEEFVKYWTDHRGNKIRWKEKKGRKK